MWKTGGSDVAAGTVLEPTAQADSFVVGSGEVWGRGHRYGTPASGPPPPPVLADTAPPQPVSARELEITGSPDGGDAG